MQVRNVLHAACCKKSSKICHLGTIAQLCRAIALQIRHVSTIGKKLAKQQYLLHMSSQRGELRPTCSWNRSGSLGHPSKFQLVSHLGSVILSTLMQTAGHLLPTCSVTQLRCAHVVKHGTNFG